MAVYAFTLVEDDVKRIELDDVRVSNKTIWVRAVFPDENEIAKLSEITNAPVEEFKEFLEQDERPRFHVSRYLQVIFRSPLIENGEVMTVPVNIFINKNIIVTVEKNKIASLSKFEELISAKKGRYLIKYNACYFLYHILDKINDEFLLNIDKISDSLDLFEKKATSLSKEIIGKIYEKSITLTVFNQALISNIEVLNTLRKAYFKFLSDKNREQFNDLYYNALQVLDTEKIQRDVISNLFNLQSLIASDKLGNLIKTLTSITILFMIPNIIAGHFGMNVKYFNFIDVNGTYADIYIMGFTLTIVLAVFGFFRWKEWL